MNGCASRSDTGGNGSNLGRNAGQTFTKEGARLKSAGETTPVTAKIATQIPLKLIGSRPGIKVLTFLFILIFTASGATLTRAGDDDPALPPDPPKQSQEGGIRWGKLMGNTMTFLTVSHAFRWAKEEYTRDATLHGPFFKGWASSIGNLHGWGDGDEFLTNYVGHPMEGAVSGYIFQHNDPKYREEEFGKNRAYWRGKTRAFVFSALYSAAFEIGPYSEATVGKIQKYWPQQGLVDWAVSPTIGLAWTLAEDSLDKYVAKYFEGKVQNAALRALVRSWLNPSRSFANLMMFKYPWHRDSRPGITTYDPSIDENSMRARNIIDLPQDSSDPYGRKRANFTFDIPIEVTSFGRLSCVGGGVNAQFPLSDSWDAVINLSGCKLIGLPQNYTGDSLTYMLGARWSPKSAGRAVPHVRLMVGGHKIYEEQLYPELQKELLAQGVKGTYYHNVYEQYTRNWHENGLAVSLGAGVDIGINRALGFRLASVDYLHSWLSKLNGGDFHEGIRVSTGLIVNMGSW